MSIIADVSRCEYRACKCSGCEIFKAREATSRGEAHDRRLAACTAISGVLSLGETVPLFAGASTRDRDAQWRQLTAALALLLEESVEQVRARYKRAETPSHPAITTAVDLSTTRWSECEHGADVCARTPTEDGRIRVQCVRCKTWWMEARL